MNYFFGLLIIIGSLIVFACGVSFISAGTMVVFFGETFRQSFSASLILVLPVTFILAIFAVAIGLIFEDGF